MIPNAWTNLSSDSTEVLPAMLANARAAQAGWAATPLARRLRYLRALRQLIPGHSAELAEASASARQRPPLESLTAEVLPLAEACLFLEREAQSILAPRRLRGRSVPFWLFGVRREIQREPLGVVLVIGPGNYPLFLPGVQVIQALAAGNAVLLKPGLGGTAAARALLGLIVRAGFDPRLVSLLPESVEAARAAIQAGPDKVLFTGSAETGRKILQQLAPHLIPATMELSGSDAVVVRADANLELVTKALAFGLTFNRGATCLAPRRAFVHRSVATELEGRLARAFPIEQSFRFQAALSAPLRPLIEAALNTGAHLIAGGLHNDGGLQLPIVLGGAHRDHRLLQEDVFAPVLAMITVGNDEEAVTHANESPFALGASIFSRDGFAAQQLARRLNAGVVSINDLIVPTADAWLPFGGRKRSGFGVTRGGEGLLELTAPKVLTATRGQVRRAFEAPHPKDEALLHAYLKLAHGTGFRQRARAAAALLKSLSGRSKDSD